MKPDIHRRSILLAALSAPFAKLALAQANWPTRPIRIIVPFPAGGGADTTLRMIASTLERLYGWNVVVENKPGAGGLLGMQDLSQSRPDGYTFMYYASTFTVVDLSQDSVDMLEQAAPITMISKTPYLIATYVDHPYNTLQDLVDAARAEPGMLRYGHGGPGSTFDLCMKLFNAAFDLDMEAVSYSGGFASLQGLARGEVEVSAAIPTALAPLEDTGRLRVLAAAQPQRLGGYRDVPTVEEALGTPFVFSTWAGMVGRAGTPPEILAAMYEALAGVVADPAFREFAANADIELALSDSIEAFESELQAEYEVAAEVVKLLDN